MTWVIDLIRMILGLLDRLIYSFIEFFYNAFIQISQVNIFTDETYKAFAGRIYIFIALIMVFKVTFSIINYIINPDNFSNGEKGVGKLIQNTVIVLALIVCVPWIFQEARTLQNIVVKGNVLGKIITGQGENVNIDNAHKDLSYTLLKAFINPNCNLSVLKHSSICSDNFTFSGENVEEDGKSYTKIDGNDPNIISLNGLSSYTQNIYDEYKQEYVKAGVGLAYAYAELSKNYQGLISLAVAKYDLNSSSSEKNEYLFQYKFIISTIAGGFVAWIILIFCFDIAIRAVKLGFLQLIAPIPIISYIDPKSGKNGMFSRWVKTCLSTYADLFIRLIAIYFAIFIIALFNEKDTAYVDFGNNFLIKVFIMLGALLFAKQLPKLIEDISGIKLSGDFTLNPMKKLGASPFAAAAIGGIGGAVGGLGANIANGIINKNGFGNTFRSALGGFGSGMFRGGMNGLNGKANGNAWNAVTAGLKGSVDARNLRAKRAANGDGGISGWARRRGVDLSNAAGIESGATKFDNELAAYSEIQNQADSILAMAEKEMIKESDYLEFIDSYGNTISMSDFKARQEELKLLQGMDTSGWKDANGNIDEAKIKQHAQRISDLSSDISITTKRAAQAWVDAAMKGQIVEREADGSVKKDIHGNEIRKIAAVTAAANIEALQAAVSRSPYKNISSQHADSGKEIKDLKDEMARVQADIKNTDEYRQAQINRRNDSNK